MATPKEKRRRAALQVLALVVLVAVAIAAGYGVRQWLNSRPEPDPGSVALTISWGDEEREVLPYLACAPGSECPEGEPERVSLSATDELTISLPRSVADHEWKLLTLYDDPRANDERVFPGNHDDEITLPGSVDPEEHGVPRPRLAVVEISSVMIGTDDDGEETPYSTIWSIGNDEVDLEEAWADEEGADE